MIKTIKVDPIFPWDIIYNPANKYIYVTNSGSGTMNIIDSSTNTVINTIPVASAFYSVYNPANKKIYVPDGPSDEVTIIDSSTNPVIKSIPVGDGPWNVAYNPANKKIYVINNLASTVSIIGSLFK